MLVSLPGERHQRQITFLFQTQMASSQQPLDSQLEIRGAQTALSPLFFKGAEGQASVRRGFEFKEDAENGDVDCFVVNEHGEPPLKAALSKSDFGQASAH